jgi:Protein of unknown function (DUF1565)/Putative metal-binding motif
MRAPPLLCLLACLGGCLDFDQFVATDAHVGPDLALGAPDLAPVADLATPADLPPLPPDLGNGCAATSRACYGGPPATEGVGVCRAGAAACVNGQYGPCTGQIVPAAESCNNLDDDCNGLVDDGLTVTCGLGACRVTNPACKAGQPLGCVPLVPKAEACGDGVDNDCNGLVDDGCGCVYVSLAGNDLNGTGSAQAPFRTITVAILAAGQNGLPMQVCVGATSCVQGQSTVFQEDVTMRNGVSVLGSYAAGQWTRSPACVTEIQARSHSGVLFDATIKNPTVLDGFRITAHDDAASAAVTIVGATGAILSNNHIFGKGLTTSYGVSIVDAMGLPSTPLLRANEIVGGDLAATAIAVQSVNSTPSIIDHCTIFDNLGRCAGDGCPWGGAGGPRIAARSLNSAGQFSFGVVLYNSKRALIDRSAVCASGANGESAGVKITGEGLGVTVRGSNVASYGAQAPQSAGIWAEPCNGASPWIFQNTRISAASSLLQSRVDGVRAIGDCHPRIDTNVLIAGGDEGMVSTTSGVRCQSGVNGGPASRCTITGNARITGSGAGAPPDAAGVRCEDGACARIERNVITGGGGQTSYGLWIGATGTIVAQNVIDAGCATGTGTGLLARDSFARVENNVIVGSNCLAANAATSFGAHVLVAGGLNELDLHSNHVLGFGGANCTSNGVAWDIASGLAPPARPMGLVRNNVLLSGQCPLRASFSELGPGADPRLFQNNDLFSGGAALYQDEGVTRLKTIDQVNALADITSSANISADPLFAQGKPRLTAMSPCIDTGTKSGAPALDIDGDPRPQLNGFDIGADEYLP